MTDPVGAADRLGERMAGLTAAVGDLRDWAARQRRHTRWLAISLAIDVVITVALVVIGINSANASNRAESATAAARANTVNLYQTCTGGNKVRDTIRTTLVGIFEQDLGLLVEQTPKHPTALEARLIAQSRAAVVASIARVNAGLADRNCGPPPG